MSRIAGARLRDGNPFITDLGDSNRPDKLAERFSELYDNEWSDVMEKMPVDESEEHKVSILLNILKVTNYIIILHMFFFQKILTYTCKCLVAHFAFDHHIFNKKLHLSISI